jgi:hypothetical protein
MTIFGYRIMVVELYHRYVVVGVVGINIGAYIVFLDE